MYTNRKITSACVALFLMVGAFACGCVGEEKVKEVKEEKIIRILIDGDDSDWHELGIQPVLVSSNDPNISDEVDIKALYLATDEEKIYAMMELYDNVSTKDHIYGISLSPNKTIEFEIDKTWLSVQIDGEDCRLSAWVQGEDTEMFHGEPRDPEFTFNHSCAVRGKIIEFIAEGTTPIYIFSSDELNDFKPLTPYTMMEKVSDFSVYGIRLAGYSYHAINKKPVERIEKSSPKISEVITKI